jgi:hypothetical protein
MFSMIYNISPIYALAMDAVLIALQTRNEETLSPITARSQISTLTPGYDLRMARSLILCLDANGRSNLTAFGDYKRHAEYMYNKSRYGGLSIAAITAVCSKLDVTPPESQRFDGVPRGDNTNSPILFISSVADPITPLSSTRKMNGMLPGSGLLVFNNYGVSSRSYTYPFVMTFADIRLQHTSHFQKVTCVSEYETQYMRDGILPPANTTCEADEPNPWKIIAEQANATQKVSIQRRAVQLML